MGLIDRFSRRQSLIVCLAGTAAIIIASAAAGFVVKQVRKPAKPAAATAQARTVGVEKVDLAKAIELKAQNVRFVDARMPADFSDGHIPGAINLDFYDFDKSFAPFSSAVDRSVPVAVYCQGINGPDTCETSRLLADKLYDNGYQTIYLFEEGYSFWVNAGNPIEQGVSSSTAAAAPAPVKPASRKMTPWAYTRDLSMLVFGLLALVMRKKRAVVALAQVILGVVFIISGAGKVFQPDKLQVIIDAYHIMPKDVTPFMAMVMPWIELLSGIALISALVPSAGALVVSGMNLGFIPALAFRALTVARESGIPVTRVDFDCGCGLGENFAWVLILRDVGFLLMGIVILLSLVQMRKGAQQ